MPRVAVRFAYDGTKFDSFARQPTRRTVEGELLLALQRAGVIDEARTAKYEVASRTDRGVSAWGNVFVISTETDRRALVHSVDLPEGLWFLTAAPVEESFSPRRQAIERTYRYHVVEQDGLEWPAMRHAGRLFLGLHDFRNFCRREPGVSTRRRIRRVAVHRNRGLGSIRIAAPNFLWEQVRRMVHAILEVGAGRRSASSIARQLEDGADIEPPSPPEPLVLEHVELPVEFPEPSKKLIHKIHQTRVDALAQSRFYAGLASSLPTMRR